MPEIIEVRTYADFIEDKVKGKTLNDIVIKNGRYFKKGPFPGYKELLKDLPLKVKDVKSKGKFMYIIFTGKNKTDICLGFTLGLSGGWFFQPKGSKTLIHGLGQKFDSSQKYSMDNKELYSGYMKNSLNHINVEFEFTSGSLKFYDTLSYGTVKIFTLPELEKKLKSLGE
jgi:formamidopyrimidine-DNA glycosylase